jgi:hypothetical protein
MNHIGAISGGTRDTRVDAIGRLKCRVCVK